MRTNRLRSSHIAITASLLLLATPLAAQTTARFGHPYRK